MVHDARTPISLIGAKRRLQTVLQATVAVSVPPLPFTTELETIIVYPGLFSYYSFECSLVLHDSALHVTWHECEDTVEVVMTL